MEESPATGRFKVALPVLVVFSLLMLLAPIPTARASIYGPYGLYTHTWLTGYTPDNAYQSYPGGTVYLNYDLVNSQTVGSITITQIQVTTPWQTYSDTSLPVTIAQGDEYFGYFAITIPSNVGLGNSTWSWTNSAVGYTTLSYQIELTIFANPTALQNQIVALNSQVASLQTQVSSLQSQLTAAQNSAASLQSTVTSLQSTVTSLQSQVSSLQSQLTTAKNNATSLQQSVVSLNSQLSTSQSQLSMTQSQLSNATAKVDTLTTQLQSAQSEISSKTAQIGTLTSQLSTTQASLATAYANLTASQGEVATYSSLYLPLGVAVPSVVAVLLLVLYLRKGSRPSGAAAKMPAPKVASSMATASSPKFCPDCGTENKSGAKFCGKCGTGLP